MILGFGNNVKGAIAADISANQTSIPVMPGTGALFASTLVPDAGLANSSLPAKIFAKVTLTDEQETIFEICHLIAVAGDTLTVLRGQEGTTARTWYIGDHIANFATRGSENLFVQVEDLQSGKYTACVAGGTENALTADIPTAFFENGGTAITLRTPLYIIPTATNTGPATILVMMSGQIIGTFPLVKGDNEPLKAGDIVGRLPALIVYNALQSNFQVINPAKGVLDVEEGEKFFLQIDENLGEIADNGPEAQKEARDNLDLDSNYLRIDKQLAEIADNGPQAQQEARENIDVVDGTLTKKGLVRLTDLSDPADEDSIELALTPAGLKKVTDAISPLTVPVGGGMLWFTPVPPDGWLEGNGQAFDPLENPKLLAVYPSGHVPDMRGYFLRGWDHGAGVDPDSERPVGSVQLDDVKRHNHTAPVERNPTGVAGPETIPGIAWGGSPQRNMTNAGTSFVGGDETRGINKAVMIIFKTDKAVAEPGEVLPTAIVVTPQNATVEAGGQLQFSATVLPAEIAPDYPVSWEASDSELGGINAAGLYTATAGRSGTQTIIAGVSTGLTTLTTLMQYIYATSIAVAPIPDISEGETYNAVVTLLPATANEPLVYSSSNNDIATFSSGVVVAQGAGTAIITATGQYSGVSGSQTVTVTPAVVVEEFLKIENNLSEIAGNGPQAQAEARTNIDATGLLKRVKIIETTGNYTPGEDVRFVIFEAVGAGGGRPEIQPPETGFIAVGGAGAGGYTKAIVDVPADRLFSVTIGMTEANGDGGQTTVRNSANGTLTGARGGYHAIVYHLTTQPYAAIGGRGGEPFIIPNVAGQQQILNIRGNHGEPSMYIGQLVSGSSNATGGGGQSALGSQGVAQDPVAGREVPGYGGGVAGAYIPENGEALPYGPGGNGVVIAWEYA